MIEFADMDGDAVKCVVAAGKYVIELADEVDIVVLNPILARALAADLIAFADSVEKEEEA